MEINLSNGLLQDVSAFIASPNFNQRPANTLIDLIVIHCISLPKGEFENDNVIKLFTNQFDGFTDKVSAHLFIRRDGNIIQFVPLHLRAWHAGVSTFQGKENCNDYSIGIELEGSDKLPYEPLQYQQLNVVIKALQKAYPAITRERIIGHEHIAPGRKTDPGPLFCWEKI